MLITGANSDQAKSKYIDMKTNKVIYIDSKHTL